MFRTHKALTLIELLISVLLISVMLGAVWLIYHTGFQVFYSQYARENIKAQAASAFLTMTNELHQALSITAATSNSITFTADLDSDGISETIQYVWSGALDAPLNRVIGAQTTQIVRSVNNQADQPLFTCYGANNTLYDFPLTASQLQNMQLIMIDLITISNNEPFHLRTNVQLRCNNG